MEKISVAVYQIDLNRFPETSFEKIIDELVNRSSVAGNQLKQEKLKKQKTGKFDLSVYSAIKRYPPKWSEFLEPILDTKSILTSCQNLVHSYVCFIGTADHIFAIAGGFGAYAIAPFSSNNFGLEILARLFEKDSKVIQAIQDRGLTGNILGQAKFYRGDQRLSDEDQFGKIFTEIKAELNKEVLTKIFGFDGKILKKRVAGCLAKNSFQINKRIDFDTLIMLIERFCMILKAKPKFSLNKVIQLTKRKDRKLIEDLDEWLIDQLYSASKKSIPPNIDFCHPNFETYLTASSYQVRLNKGEAFEFNGKFDDLLCVIKKEGQFLNGDVHEYKYSLLERVVEALDEDGEEMTTEKAFHHIHAEVTYQNKNYFRVDGEWYQILPAFVRELNEECAMAIKDAWDETLINERFDGKKEGDFNLKFIGKNGYLVFDTITPSGIEACDILEHSNGVLHLIHVKQGFDNSVRDLASQIHIAAKRIREDIRTGFEYVNKLEVQAKKGKTSASPNKQKIGNQIFPKEGLATLFNGKRHQDIIFCLAVFDDASTVRYINTDITKYDSNIAKFSLLELKREIDSMGFGFKVIQLKK